MSIIEKERYGTLRHYFLWLPQSKNPPVHLDLYLTLTEALDVFLQVVLFLSRVDAGQVHPVVAAVLLSLVPVGLQVIKYLR